MERGKMEDKVKGPGKLGSRSDDYSYMDAINRC